MSASTTVRRPVTRRNARATTTRYAVTTTAPAAEGVNGVEFPTAEAAWTACAALMAPTSPHVATRDLADVRHLLDRIGPGTVKTRTGVRFAVAEIHGAAA